jgi:hypothetical protein
MKRYHLLIAVCGLSLSGCLKSPDLGQLSVNFTTITNRAPSANFGNYKTYYLSDSVGQIASDSRDSFWVDDKSKQLVNTVKANMNERGYTFVPKGSKPDIGLVLTAIKNINIGAIYPGWWYGGYWGGCYWGYCGYPPYYGYGYPIYYEITTGTVVIDMVDVKNAGSSQNLPVIWTSVNSGGLGYSFDDLQLAIDAINQSFTQSPYITTK